LTVEPAVVTDGIGATLRRRTPDVVRVGVVAKEMPVLDRSSSS
jgi:hypothetical protein